MVLLGKDHEQLERRYPSEPILVKAFCQAAPRYGRAKPLETLVSVIRDGQRMIEFL
jgi:hypothetical protein